MSAGTVYGLYDLVIRLIRGAYSTVQSVYVIADETINALIVIRNNSDQFLRKNGYEWISNEWMSAHQTV